MFVVRVKQGAAFSGLQVGSTGRDDRGGDTLWEC